MRAENWSGLITNASPYALPPGAAVEQVNLHNAVPGQLTSRGGMRRVVHQGASFSITDCCAVDADGRTFLLALGEDGLHALESPAADAAQLSILAPEPSEDNGVVETTYLWEYRGYGASAVNPGPPDPPTDPFVAYLDGGRSGTSSYSFIVNANEQCPGDNRISVFDGGRSSTDVFPETIRESQLCELP